MIYDTVIIGAGPAGAYAGCMLAKVGLKVALVDRRDFPRDKLCGGLLTYKTLDLLQPVLSSDQFFKFSITMSHVFYQGQSTTSFQLLSPAYTVRRLQFDALLVEIAQEHGVHTYLGASLQSVDFNQKEVCLSDGHKLKYSTLIGADGALSKVRYLAGLPKNDMGFCVEAHIPWDQLRDSKRLRIGGIEIYYGDYPNGYGWVFPNKDTVAVGVGNLAQGMMGKEILAQYRRFLADIAASENTKATGAYLPSGTSVVLGTPLYGELFLIGDAAGLIDPFTGEGIYYAFLSAKVVADTIVSGRPVFQEYERQMKQVVKTIRDTVRIRDRIYSPAVLKHLLDFMHSTPQYSEQLIDETIVRYTKSYMDAYDEIKYYSR